MITNELINRMNEHATEFANQTNALEVEFAEDKKIAIWSLKYNIIKLEFVLTKKEKILCPKHTLFCRVYLGKNDVYFYHLPEMMHYLEAENYQCYYYSYIESTERLDACMEMLFTFLYRNFEKIKELARNPKESDQLKADKLADMLTLFLGEEPEAELEEYMMDGYENYVLLVRYTGDSAYRQLLLGNYEFAIKEYRKLETKSSLTEYEKRLLAFLQERNEEYELLPDACNGIRNVKEWDNPNKEGLSIFMSAICLELVIGGIFSVIVMLINAVLSEGTIYYVGMHWGFGFLFAGCAAIFGGIASRNLVRRFLQKEIYEEGIKIEKMINPKWIEPFARVIFLICLLGGVLGNVETALMSTRFYETHMSYDLGEDFLKRNLETYEYEKIKNVYYSEGVYNEYGDYIDRPSYLIEFEDGEVWDSDGFMRVEDVEENILPILSEYYDSIIQIESRNDLIE